MMTIFRTITFSKCISLFYTTASLYRNSVKKESDPYFIFTRMSDGTIKKFEELAKELKRANPKTKEEVTRMIETYSLESAYKI